MCLKLSTGTNVLKLKKNIVFTDKNTGQLTLYLEPNNALKTVQ